MWKKLQMKICNIKVNSITLSCFKGDVPLEAGHGILAAISMFFVQMTWKIGIVEALYASLRG